jgi:hypothetical protein
MSNRLPFTEAWLSNDVGDATPVDEMCLPREVATTCAVSLSAKIVCARGTTVAEWLPM